MLAAAVIIIGACISGTREHGGTSAENWADVSGCAAAPDNDVVTTNIPPLFTMNGNTPVVSVKDITGLTSESMILGSRQDWLDTLSADLPPGSDWFTAALIAAVNCKTPNSINRGTAVRQINYTAAAFSLHAPESPEQTEVVVDVRELPVLPPTGSPW